MLMGRETGSLQLLAPLLLTEGKGADLVIRVNVVLNNSHSHPIPSCDACHARTLCPVASATGTGATTGLELFLYGTARLSQ
jgi:hypothetical protein